MIIHKDFPLSEILWYKIGGTAKHLITVENKEDVLRALDFVEKKHVEKIFVCGLGSNLIFTDDYFDGAVIQIVSTKENSLSVYSNNLLSAYAGDTLDDVIKFSFEKKLTGLEWAGGLPGTIGAGVRGNVGAFGGEVKDSIEKVEVLDYSTNNLDLKVLDNEELQFEYRGSLIKHSKKMIVVSATFLLQQSKQEEIAQAKEIYFKNMQYRKDHHPLEFPNCGSVFKNIKKKEEVEKILSLYPELQENVEKKWYGKIAAAVLIEKLGFKEYRIGDAQVSPKHALFIVNLGHAKAKDVLQIISDIQEKFQETFGFSLEVEPEIVR